MDDIPESRIEQVAMMEGILISRATGGSPDGHAYEYLRLEVLADVELRGLVPEFVRTCRDLGAFWSHIKPQLDRYEERRIYIRAAFAPVMDHLEACNRAPSDGVVTDALVSFDPQGVHAVWTKAVARRTSDPEGAITVARTLVEAVCKHILALPGHFEVRRQPEAAATVRALHGRDDRHEQSADDGLTHGGQARRRWRSR